MEETLTITTVQDLYALYGRLPEEALCDVLAADLKVANFSHAIFTMPNGAKWDITYTGPSMTEPSTIGQREFHLEQIVFDLGEDKARLEIIYRDGDNGVMNASVLYAIPEGFQPVMDALAAECPMHMVGFEHQDGQLYLADARTTWGYSCPCNDR